MALPTGRTAYKKQVGILSLSSDSSLVTWTPGSGQGTPTVRVLVASITNLQQTPDSNPKVMLKIFAKAPNTADAESFVFHFNAPEARAEANAIRDLLSRLIAGSRGNEANVPAAATPSGPASGRGESTASPILASGSASMTFATTANSSQSVPRWFDDVQLKADIELQQSLMKTNRALHQTYMDARATKPMSISDAAFNAQFWSTRTALLRAHAIEAGQRKGAYNVLSAIKPRAVEGEDNASVVNLTVEQVQLILAQHPLVKRLYNENVPKPLSEAEFWSRFFLSQLAYKLRGERIVDGTREDPLFDRHKPSEDTNGFQTNTETTTRVARIIDVEANEENQGGFRSGNQKDVEMRSRPTKPVVKALNSISGKILANVAPSGLNNDDGDGGVDVGAGTYGELVLRDLKEDAHDNRMALKVKEQSRFFSRREDVASSENAAAFAKQDPSRVLAGLASDMAAIKTDDAGGIDLSVGIGIDENSDSEEEEGANSARKKPHVGSRASIKAAHTDIMTGLSQARSERFGHNVVNLSSASTPAPNNPMGLTPDLLERCNLTHATTVEFLHQFWTAFLSGDPDRTAELQYLFESLRRSAERIDAVAADAEKGREEIIQKRKLEIRSHYEKTGKKIRWKADMVGGGRDAVVKMMIPTLDALKRAQDEYRQALVAEGVQVATEAANGG